MASRPLKSSYGLCSRTVSRTASFTATTVASSRRAPFALASLFLALYVRVGFA
eukprot:CAMPEP_0181381228 /NCGR_PEP_ID=MMETSP1106-20121128/20003_1 /TAXON_ID=81844 /ORGANISM="Mantoniella antarctica, Strain SL-175" /LENGTH=52 /DNA_ID=CAMNT_0023500385 /DNA_START=489 /DNA_END=644 /DNA_ORIENTATION=-